jgi:two-component system sensor histidine kinase KdpD
MMPLRGTGSSPSLSHIPYCQDRGQADVHLVFHNRSLNGSSQTVSGGRKGCTDREIQTNALFQLTGGLSKARGTDEVIRVATDHFRKHFGAEAVFIIQEGNYKTDHSRPETGSSLPDKPDPEITDWVLSNRRKAGKFTAHRNEAALTYYPLTGARINTGVVVFKIDEENYKDKDEFWDTYCTHIANALEREFLDEMAIKARVLDESDRFYGTLFNLVSHEFRIPIATIMGAADTLMFSETSAQNREALSGEIFKASARLNHMTENLLKHVTD